MFVVALEELRSPKGPNIMIFVWAAAWVAHAVMSVAWIADFRLHRAWPIVGVLLGIGSFVLLPFTSKSVSFTNSELTVLLEFLSIQLVLVSPCVLLAVWLVRFQLRAKPVQVIS